MDMNIQMTNAMSAHEQQHIQEDLVWALDELPDQWQAGHWCITLKTQALTLSLLLPKTAAPLEVAIEALR